MRGRLVGALIAVALVATPSAEPASGQVAGTGGVPLRTLAASAGLRIGATLDPGQLGDADHTATLAREFSAVTAENAMKWYSIEPTRDQRDYSGADAVLAFAEAHDLEVRGHNLVWAQDRYTPSWLLAIDDPVELREQLDDHVRGVLERYRGRIHRWDVVNEPLDTFGSATSGSVFERVLGPGWLADTYRLAHEVDPEAELWLNEYGADWNPAKHAALLALLRGLLDDGVELHGIGLQTHRLSADGPDRAAFQGFLQDYADLGLAVAITELDVAVAPDDPDGLGDQADAYRTIVTSCLAVEACEEVTTWGISDRDTWLDELGLLPVPTRPLLFDEAFAPKPAYDAVADVLAAGREAARASTPTSTTTSAPNATTTTGPAQVGPPAARPAQPLAGDATYTG